MSQAYEMFLQLSDSMYKGVRGVCRIDAAEPGPVLGVGIGTHGNEVEGLAAIKALKGLTKGSVILTLCNLEALSAHFDDSVQTPARYLDVNMNRLPEQLYARAKASEIRRARELRTVFQEFEHGIDIHSTPEPTKPMALNVRGHGLQLVEGAGIPIQIKGLLEHQEGVPLSSMFGGSSVVGVEVGQQGTTQAWKDAGFIVTHVLHNLGMVGQAPKAESCDAVEYQVIEAVSFPNCTYQFMPRLTQGFATVEKGETIAYGDGPCLTASQDGVLLFPRKGLSKLTDEAAFLARKTP